MLWPLTAWVIKHLSKKPFPVFDHCHGKEVFTNDGSELKLVQILITPMSYHWIPGSSAAPSPGPSLGKLQRAMRLPVSLFSS